MMRRHVAALVIGYLAVGAACALGVAWVIWWTWQP